MVLQGRTLFFFLYLVSAYAQQYARLTDQHYSVHFAEESTSTTVTIQGNDARFQPITQTEDYTMMSWVHIQEDPSATDTMIWKIAHGVVFTTILKYSASDSFTFCIRPTSAENVWDSLTPSSSPPNLWVHTSIRIQGQDSQATLCIHEWGGELKCVTSAFTGAVTSFNINSTVQYGAGYDDSSLLSSPKMQILDLRYYIGTSLLDAEIESIIDNTGCHSSCTGGCQGPGNYSCSEFIQLIDQHDGWTGDGAASPGVEGTTWVKFGGTDSFMMGRAWSGSASAFTGRINWSYIDNGWVNLFRAGEVDDNNTGYKTRIPAIFHIPSEGYWYDHCIVSNANFSLNTGNGTGYTQNTWNFVSFSSWVSTQKLETCYTDTTGSLSCMDDSSSEALQTMDNTASYAYLWVGDKWHTGPACTFKDVRYYHTGCVDQNEVNNINATLGCTPNCLVCQDPETCAECVTGFTLDSGTCLPCSYGCDTCGSQTNCSTCATGYYLDTYNNTCYPCSPGRLIGSNWCHDYLQEGACVSQCSIGYHTDTDILQCIQCPLNCDSCSSETTCTTCSANYSLIDGICVACPSNCDSCSSSTTCTACTSPYVVRDDGQCQTSCLDGQFDNGSGVCAACHGSCSTWTGAEYDKWLTCATGLSKLDNTAAPPFAWDCTSTANASKQVKIACLSNSSATNSDSSSTSGNSKAATILSDVSQIIDDEDLSLKDYESVFGTIADQNLISASQEQQAIGAIVEGGIKVMANTDTKTLSITSEKFDAQFTQEDQAGLQGSQITTPTGSGVLIPIDLVAQDVVAPDANLVVNVIHMKQNETNPGILSDYDIISVSITQLLDNGQVSEVVYQNLTTNFTIMFENQSYNTTDEFEWVFLQANEWITDGCVLNSIESSRSECACNHLTNFSMRNMRKGAKSENNAAASTDISNVTNYSLDTNQTPLILLLSIFVIWFPIFILLRRGDLKLLLHPEEQTQVMFRHAFARVFGRFKQTQNESFDSVLSPTSADKHPVDLIKVQENPSRDQTKNQVTTIRPNTQENAFETVTFRNVAKNENAGPQTLTSDQTKQVADDPNKEVVPNISFKRRFFATHKIIGIFVNDGEKILRSELWAIFLCIFMLSIFVTGLFYQDKSSEDESKKSFTETLEAFAWEDFWIIFYSICITLPMPFILRWFFLRKKLDRTKNVAKQVGVRNIKRTIGYILIFLIVAWCAWSCITFSLEFGYNATQRWMITFGISEALDLSIEEFIVALSIVLWRVVYSYISHNSRESEIIDPQVIDVQIEGQEVEADMDNNI